MMGFEPNFKNVLSGSLTRPPGGDEPRSLVAEICDEPDDEEVVVAIDQSVSQWPGQSCLQCAGGEGGTTTPHLHIIHIFFYI